MERFSIFDQTSHSHVQFRKRHVIHVHWAGNGPEWRRCFVGINFLRGNNHIARPKSSKYMFTERLAISLTYSSFGFTLRVFPTYNSLIDWHLCCSSHLILTFGSSELHNSQPGTHQLIPISKRTNYWLEMVYFIQHSYIILSLSKCAYFSVQFSKNWQN